MYTFAFRRPAIATGGDSTVDLIVVNKHNVGLCESSPHNNGPGAAVCTVD